jgi:hypothetical protein
MAVAGVSLFWAQARVAPEVYDLRRLRVQLELPFDSYSDFVKLARTFASKAPFLNEEKIRFQGNSFP